MFDMIQDMLKAAVDIKDFRALIGQSLNVLLAQVTTMMKLP